MAPTSILHWIIKKGKFQSWVIVSKIVMTTNYVHYNDHVATLRFAFDARNLFSYNYWCRCLRMTNLLFKYPDANVVSC